MKKRYTRKHICEALRYWKKQLKRIDESFSKDKFYTKEDLYREYDIEIKPQKHGQFCCDLDGISPEDISGEPYSNLVIQSILDKLEEVNYGQDRNSLVYLMKIDFSHIGASVSFCSKSEDALVKFLNEWFIIRK